MTYSVLKVPLNPNQPTNLVMSPVGGNLRKLNTGAQLQTFPYPTASKCFCTLTKVTVRPGFSGTVPLFTARRSYASAVLGVVILSARTSVCPSCPSVCVTRVLCD